MDDSQPVVSRAIPEHRIRELLAALFIRSSALLVSLILIWILLDIAWRGLSEVSWEFLVGQVNDAGRSGGIGPVIQSTAMILVVTLVLAVPLSLATAIALTERMGNQTQFAVNVRRCLDILAGVPSVVFGLFGNAFFSITLGLGYSILSGGLTLACMVLPILIRSFEQAIAGVPQEYRLAAAAVGLGRPAVLGRVVLPLAAPALLAGVVLSVARALAETAALIFTSGYVARSPETVMDSGRSLSVHIYDMAMNVPGGTPHAYGTACVLVVLLLLINLLMGMLLRLAGFQTRLSAGERS